jgi:hypothetical protein
MRTSKLAVAVLPEKSVELQVTVVDPIGKTNQADS